ncbi:MAG: hypothetical protein ABI706_16910 [Ilumatobacteraceae bacterium]
MRRFLMSTVVASGAVVLAACGSGDYGGNAPTTKAAPTAAGGFATVSVAAVPGYGNILVDPKGRALYSTDEEADGTVLCVDKCTSFWAPLAAGSAAPTGGVGAPAIGVVDRPDGSKQVTAAGRPLYTFSHDSPGSITGDGVGDDFGSQHFTWHLILADGTPRVVTENSTPNPPNPYGAGPSD